MRHPRLSTVPGLAPASARRVPGPTAPPLLAVAHGSQDPRAAATITSLMGLVSDLARRRGLALPELRTAYLGHAPPSVTQALGALAAAGWPARGRRPGAAASSSCRCC